jgi:hypothetical protein
MIIDARRYERTSIIGIDLYPVIIKDMVGNEPWRAAWALRLTIAGSDA